jgi:hypothetical protein
MHLPGVHQLLPVQAVALRLLVALDAAGVLLAEVRLGCVHARHCGGPMS